MSSNLKVNTIQPSSGDTVSIAGIASVTSSVSIASSCTATTFYGSGANLTGITGTTINNNANNRVITGSGTANTLEGEANLTYDGSKLSIKGVDTATGSGGPAALEIKQGDANNEFVNLSLQTGSGGPLAVISAVADATGVYPNTTGQIRFSTQVGGGLFERMFIKSNGDIGLGESSPNRSGYSSPVTSVGYNSSNGYGVLELLGNQTSDNTIANIVAYNVGGSSRLAAIAFERSGANNSGAIRFETYNSGSSVERLRITSAGKILGGNHLNDRGAVLQIESSDHAQIGIHRNTNDHGAPAMMFSASRGTSAGSNTIVQSGDYLGMLNFSGADGSDLAAGAYITAIVDGTPGSNDMPTRLGFWTSADGSQSPTERLRIDSSGNMGLGVTPSYSGLFGGSQTTFQIGGTAAPCLKITSSTSGQADLILHAGNSARRADIANLATNGSISIWTKPSSGSIAERFKISSAGYVTKPATPAFFATHTSASSSITGTLTYNTSGNGYYNNGGHLDVSTGRFHAPVDGIYHFHFHGFFQSGQSNNYYEVIMYRKNSNGSGNTGLTRQYGYRDQATNQYGPSISMQCTCSLTAGQTVEVSTGGLSFHGANGWYFGGYLLG